jgi:serine/threonine-protein kinase
MSTETLIGQTLGKYKITQHLGRGGMAEVYKGYREDLDRTVAIKLMHAFLVAEQDFLFRFKREARAMAKMRHTNIVSVYDFDVHGDNIYYLVMEYIGGGTLKEKLMALAEKGLRLPLDHAIRIAMEVANALTYAHSREMVHRDIKPANIMLDETGKAILTDFGIVKLVGGQSMAFTATGALIGTPAYMSPEQALGKPGDARSDLYSLGVLLFQMVTGQLPYAADTPLAVVMKHVNDPLPVPTEFNPDVPVQVQEIILRAMAKEPEDRYQSSAEMAAALRAVNPSHATAAIPGIASEGATVVSSAAGPVYDTSGARTSVSSTALGRPGTAVAQPPAIDPTVAIPPPIETPKRRVPWVALIGVVGVLIAVAAIFFSGLLSGGGDQDPTATALVAVAPPEESATPVEPTEAVAAQPATATVEPSPGSGAEASAQAAIDQTATALVTPSATATPVPSDTPTTTPTSTPANTPDATATFLASCVYDAELVSSYTYRESTNSAPVSFVFPINWLLTNSGSCNWPAGMTLAYVEGTEFSSNDPAVVVADSIAPGEQVLLSTRLVAPATVNSFDSVWQLRDPDGNPFGSAFTFQVRTYVPATATPVASPTPVATDTPEVIQALAMHFAVGGCEYIGTEWRCIGTISPYGGAGGPFTVWVFDQDQPAEYRGPGPFTHFLVARRCGLYLHNIRIQDNGGEFLSIDVAVNPDDYFAGGCTLP